mmetsp:Transcript_2175/g.8527  ORF Transcript_2175/g.8527 Transcript_2175/m.8527 type:complete len:230 (-) Transcript_2175:532-1221(-)
MLPGFVSTVVVGRRGLCRMASLQKVVVPAQGEHRSTAIFLHGLGDSGEGWQPLVPYMTSSHIKFILPSAPYRRLTMFGGEAVPSWTDVKNLEEGTPEDKEGFIECVGMVNKIIQEEKAAGIDPSSIVVGGFSQGGAVALTSLARLEEKIAGIVALSTWLPLRESYPEELSESNKETPILMCHVRTLSKCRSVWPSHTTNPFLKFSFLHSMSSVRFRGVRTRLFRSLGAN